MKKHLFLLSCPLLLSGGLFAQDSNPDGYTDFDAFSSSIQYPTLGKEVTSGIDYYTGTANINVALYTISSYGYKIPISLKYAASGKKDYSRHNTIASDWELTGGSYIKRTVKGRPDEKGWLAGKGAIAANSLASEWKRDALEEKISIRFDSEPDFYQFELPNGKSGGFVMNYDKSISLIPYQDVKIEWMNDSVPLESYFVITDTDGLKYYFGTSSNSREISQPYTGSGTAGPNDYISFWMLERITDGGNQIAQYNYRSTGGKFNDNDNTLWRFEYNAATNSVKYLSYYQIRNKIYTRESRELESITWDLGKVVFPSRQSSYSRDLIKIFGYDNELLKSIIVKDTSPGGIGSVFEVSNGHRREICSFEYYDGPDSYYKDRWGYPTGEKHITGDSDYPQHMFNGCNVPGFSRDPDFLATRKGAVKKINYPTGGWTEFEYELHQGRYPYENWTGPLQTVGGLRIKSITNYAGPNSASAFTQYVYQHPSDPAKGGQIFSGPLDTRTRKNTGLNGTTIYGVTLNPDFQMFDMTGSSVLYNYVKEILPNGSYNEYEFTGLSDYMDIRGECALSTPSGLSSYATDMFSCMPYSSQYFKRGMLKQKRQYNSSGQIVHTESYTYSMGPQKSVVYSYPLFCLNPENDVPAYYKGRYQWISQPVVLSSKTTSGLYETPVTTTYSYLSDYSDLFPRTIEQTSGENSIKTTIKYPQDYYSGLTTAQPDTLTFGPQAEAYGIAWLKNNGVKSVPIETIKYRKAAGTSVYNVVGGSINLYVWSPIANKWLPGISEPLIVNTLGTAVTNSYINESQKTLVRDSRYDHYVPQILSFNQKGNPTTITNAGTYSISSKIIYGYGGHIPTAYVKNTPADYSYASYTSFEEGETSAIKLGSKAKSGDYALNKNIPYTVHPSGATVSYWRWDGNENTDWEEVRITPTTNPYTILEPNHYIDEVRTIPAGATMTTQVVKPGVGVISKVDEKGAGIRYNYNDFGMLESVANHAGQIVEKYSYSEIPDSPVVEPTLYHLSAVVASGSSSRGQAFVSTAQVNEGGSATWTATAYSGSVFDRWEFSDGTTSTTVATTKTNISRNLTGTAYFKEKPKQIVNFQGTIMPKNGYWGININSNPDIISYGSVKVYATGYFFINPDSPDRIDAQFEGEVGEDGYVLSNALFDENDSTGELNGTIFISDPNYTVGTVSWH